MKNILDKGEKTENRNKILILVALSIGFFVFFNLVASQILQNSISKDKFDADEKKITLKNETGEVANITLLTPIAYNVIRGKDRKVACLQIDNQLEGYQNLFEKVDFYNLKDNNASIQKDFKYKYKVQTGEEEIPLYETVCKTDKDGNEHCKQTEKGKETVPKFEYVVFNNSSPLPKGITEICLFADVEAGENIEWQPTVFGNQLLDEFASWNETYNTDLISYYNFEESGGGILIDRVAGKHNGTVESGVVYSVSGIISNSFSTASADIEIVNHTDYRGLQNFTISVWGFANSTANIYLIRKGQTGSNVFRIYQETGNLIYGVFDSDCTTERTVQRSTDYGANNWNNFVLTKNGSNIFGWINGVNFANATSASLCANANDNLTIGSSGIGNFWTGAVDEVSIWNRTLSANEIVDLYNGGVGISFTLLPNITITSPVNVSNFTTNLIGVNFSSASASQCWWTNDTGVSNNSIACGTNITSLFTQGNHTVIVYANNTAGQTSDAVNFLIDSIQPSITITAPSGTSTNTSVIGNVTVTDAYLQACTFNVSRGASTEISSTTFICRSGIANQTLNFTVSGAATYIFWVGANDSLGNFNYSSQQFIMGSSSSSGSPGGGGGAANINIFNAIENATRTDICVPKRQPFEIAYGKFKSDISLPNFFDLVKSFFRFTSCRGASTIIPLN